MPDRREVLKQFGGALAGGLAACATRSLARADDGAVRRIKLGQIGTTHAHASKLGVYRNSPDYEVVGVVEPDPQARQRAENDPAFRGLPWMTEEQLLATPGLEAVLVETRVRDLLRTAETCVAAGKHVHIDKPPGESLPHLRRILDAAAKQNLLVQMGYMYRYNPAVVLLRELLQRGWLGEPFEVHAVMSKVVAPVSRQQLAEYRGRHHVRVGLPRDGPGGRRAGSADAASRPTRITRPRSTTGCMDNMLAVLDYPRATATVKASALEVEGGERRHLVVCGSEGTMHIQPLDNPSARLALSKPRGSYRDGLSGNLVSQVLALRRRRRGHGPGHSRNRSGPIFPPSTTWPCKRRCCRPAACRSTAPLCQRRTDAIGESASAVSASVLLARNRRRGQCKLRDAHWPIIRGHTRAAYRAWPETPCDWPVPDTWESRPPCRTA